jgi:predicted RNA-binding protein with EMAP domain
MLIVTHNSPEDNYISVKEGGKFDKKVKKIIFNNLKEVEKTLKENKDLFLAISKYLTDNSFIDQKNLKKLVERINPDIVKSLKDKDNYFNFKERYYTFFDVKDEKSNSTCSKRG